MTNDYDVLLLQCKIGTGRRSQLGFFGIFKASSNSCMISGEASMTMAHPTYLFMKRMYNVSVSPSVKIYPNDEVTILHVDKWPI